MLVVCGCSQHCASRIPTRSCALCALLRCIKINIPGIPNDVRKLLFTLPPRQEGDSTPPEVGEVVAGQGESLASPPNGRLGTLKVRYSNFADMESDIKGTAILVGSEDMGGDYAYQVLEGNPEEWDGEIRGVLSGAVIHICVEAMNGVGLTSTGCAEPMIWDTDAPQVTTRLWHSGREAYLEQDGPSITNSSTSIRCLITAGDPPSGMSTASSIRQQPCYSSLTKPQTLMNAQLGPWHRRHRDWCGHHAMGNEHFGGC